LPETTEAPRRTALPVPEIAQCRRDVARAHRNRLRLRDLAGWPREDVDQALAEAAGTTRGTPPLIARWRANELHRLLLRARPLTVDTIYGLVELHNWPREIVSEAIGDLAADGRIGETATGTLIVRKTGRLSPPGLDAA
jgi:hypothetical protein